MCAALELQALTEVFTSQRVFVAGLVCCLWLQIRVLFPMQVGERFRVFWVSWSARTEERGRVVCYNKLVGE